MTVNETQVTAFDRQVREGLEQIFGRYPMLRNEAGRRLIFDTIARFVGNEGAAPSLELYELALANPPADNPQDVVKATKAAMSASKVKSIAPDLNFGAAKARQEATDAQAVRDRANDEAWALILSTYPIASHDANKAVVLEWCQGRSPSRNLSF